MKRYIIEHHYQDSNWESLEGYNSRVNAISTAKKYGRNFMVYGTVRVVDTYESKEIFHSRELLE